ncbi:Lcl C-terminal domain-containing protein [Pseudoalteromonas rubra]|uniref:Lcl C-terminal domain-containing protein n=1 Tax=Pseudoalteromonas rubra TaxID=43658 RepID=A0A0U2XUU4_9GAMM|nr:DUF1566 domain-containing protein [Pseudoalteromonas rubra]ALU41826.1 hypothetical protein AT705_02125 [Pseudoalteromonas rubra]
MITRLLMSLATAVIVISLLWIEPLSPVVQPHPRFVKLDQSGHPLSPWQGPWSCVLDTQKDLVWEVKTDSENIHDGYWTYSWYLSADETIQSQARGEANLGDCYFESSRCDTQDLINRARQTALCGLTHWRLPTSGELSSLLQNPARPGHVHIAQDFFPHMKHGDYWSADHSQPLSGHYQRFKQGATAVNFHTGEQYPLPYRNAAFVLLVADLPTEFQSTRLKGVTH